MDVNALFATAEQHFAQGRFDEAATLLNRIRGLVEHPAIYHLLGLVERSRGATAAALEALKRAARLAPNDAQIANNLANTLADAGQATEAIAHFDRAAALSPDWIDPRLNRALTLAQIGRAEEAKAALVEILLKNAAIPAAWNAMADLCREEGNIAGAVASYEQTLAIDAAQPTALRGRARIALERGEADAVTRHEVLLARFPSDESLLLSDAEAREAAGAPNPAARIEHALETKPDWVEGQALLARMRWESGARDSFTDALESALTTAPRNRALWITLIEALAGADLFERAAAAAARARSAIGPDAELALREAIHAGEAGDDDRAEALFATLPAAIPGRPVNEARHRIRRGEWDRADALLGEALAGGTHDIAAWALRAIVWRQSGDDRFAWLHDRPGMMATQMLDLSEAELTAIADLLRQLHRTRAHPIGQSLRGGTQTRGSLFARIEPEIARLTQSIEAAVHTHWSALPPRDPTHPLLRHRDATPKFAGSWSVRLTESGFHVAHIHPQGLLSSAAYFALPAGAQGGEGWLELGRPPADLRLDLPPICAVEPRPGLMALFPSTLHHGTRPFASGERLTVAFDVIV